MTEKNEMTLNEYQERAMSTCMDTCDNFSYMFLNLVGEVGELASKVAKAIRKKDVVINHGEIFYHDDYDWDTAKKEQMQEIADCLWMIAGLARVYGVTLEELAQMNLDKLAKRKEAGTIDGNGDGIYDRT